MWQEKHQEVVNTVDRLEMEVDRLTRATLSKNAVVLGIPTKENENAKELIRQVAAAVGYDIDENKITEARRLVGKGQHNNTAPILVSFDTENCKVQLIEHKRVHGVLLASSINASLVGSMKRVTIRDELTSFGRELLREAKEVQELLDIKYIWPGRDGKVMLKRHDAAKVEFVCSKQQLHALTKKFLKRNLNMSSSSSASPLNPSPKRPNLQN